MDSKKCLFSEQILSPRRKVVSGFSLGVGASLIVLTLLLLNSPFRASKVPLFFQRSDSVRANSSFLSWPFSFSTSSTASSSSSISNATLEFQNSASSLQSIGEGNLLGKTHQASVSDTGEIDNMEVQGIVSENTPLGNFSGYGKNGNIHNEERSVQHKTHEANGSVVVVKPDTLASKRQGLDSGKTPVDNASVISKDASLLGEERRVTGNSSLLGNPTFGTQVSESKNVGNFTHSIKPGRVPTEENSIENNNCTVSNNNSQLTRMQSGSYKNCDIYDGKWVRDDSKPYYPAGSCPYIDRDFDCHLNGRPDGEYVKWKWQPNGCLIPSLNATDFLERLRGKKMVFVGDSLNRNMWESMVCILRQSIGNKKRVYEISGRREFKKKGFYAFRFEDYNCSVDFVSSPFLVQESTFRGRNGSIETLRLDLMDQTTSMYHDADIIVFNTGHWWTHEKTSRGEDYYQEGNYVHPRLKVLNAYKRALTTWARWIDRNIDGKRTQVIFRGYSVTHFRGGQWNSGGHCHKQTEPILNETHLAKYPSKMRALGHVLQEMKTPVIYLNISRLTDYRKDAHPSIYRMEYKTEAERLAAEQYQDCSHWCLPGVPDTWNELLYVSLLKSGKDSWKS
ncbi:Protein trichome birefringence-like [Quillaja saponaria]|uniref:Protein trichome birefringence-like n=1 Tax=Quillaja saponaria TaxID=32244 RepID=A0AAD7KPT1_QUISA|nr:Protein trichome birefringence-like [Quillaja saponaria]